MKLEVGSCSGNQGACSMAECFKGMTRSKIFCISAARNHTPHSSSMHPPCILHASSMHPPCILYASSMHPLCILHASSMHPLCILHASSMHPPCILHASSMHPSCIFHASFMTSGCCVSGVLWWFDDSGRMKGCGGRMEEQKRSVIVMESVRRMFQQYGRSFSIKVN